MLLFSFELQIPMQLKGSLKNGTLSLRDLDNKVKYYLIEFLESESFKAERRAKVTIYNIHNYNILFKMYHYCREEAGVGEGKLRRREVWTGNRQ